MKANTTKHLQELISLVELLIDDDMTTTKEGIKLFLKDVPAALRVMVKLLVDHRNRNAHWEEKWTETETAINEWEKTL